MAIWKPCLIEVLFNSSKLAWSLVGEIKYGVILRAWQLAIACILHISLTILNISLSIFGVVPLRNLSLIAMRISVIPKMFLIGEFSNHFWNEVSSSSITNREFTWAVLLKNNNMWISLHRPTKGPFLPDDVHWQVCTGMNQKSPVPTSY